MYNGKIIDAHAHIFPQKIAEKAAQNIGKFYGIEMNACGTIETLLSKSSGTKMYKAVVNSSATRPEQVRSINDFIAEAVADNQNFVGLISLHPHLSVSEIDKEIEFALQHKMRGIKLHPDFQMFNIDDEKANNIYDAAAGVLPILFHIGDERYDFSHPKRLVRVLKKHPELKAIAAHFGGYSKWDEVGCYDEVDNCWFDTSSSLFRLSKDRANELISRLGVDKMMYGTDFPMWNPLEEIERFMALGLSDNDNKSILFDNAKLFFNID